MPTALASGEQDERREEVAAPPIVSITVPIYNEEADLAELLRRITAAIEPLRDRYEFEILFVDDGSSDRSLATAVELSAQEPRLKIIELRRNYGQTAALQAGLDHARGEIVISMDGDLQHFPEEIPLFLEQIEAGFDVVCGWRHKRKEGIFRRWPSRVANFLIRRVSGAAIHDIGTTYRAYRAEIIRDLHLLGENHRFVPVFAIVAGARIGEVKIGNAPRAKGKSSYGLGRTINVLLDIFFLAFYTRYFDRPIRIFGKFSLLLFGAGSVIMGVLIYLMVVEGGPVVREHSGWFILALVMYLVSLQLLLTGFLSEVLVRLYYRPGVRSAYHIRTEWARGVASQTSNSVPRGVRSDDTDRMNFVA